MTSEAICAPLTTTVGIRPSHVEARVKLVINAADPVAPNTNVGLPIRIADHIGDIVLNGHGRAAERGWSVFAFPDPEQDSRLAALAGGLPTPSWPGDLTRFKTGPHRACDELDAGETPSESSSFTLM